MGIETDIIQIHMGVEDPADFFLDARSKRLVAQYSLKQDRILIDFAEITMELKSSDGKLHLGLDDPGTPLNIFQHYIEMAACAAAVNYGLSSQQSLILPDTNSRPYMLSRKFPPEAFEARGRGFEKLIEKLKARRTRFLEETVSVPLQEYPA